MPDLDSDRLHLSQAPIDPKLHKMLREARQYFDPKATAARTRAENEKTMERRRTFRAAKRAAARLPAKVANKRARDQRHRMKLRLAMKLEDRNAATLIATTPCPAEALAIWLTTSGREQGAARRIEDEAPGDLMATREAMLRAREQGVTLSLKGYAEAFAAATGRPWSREQARRRVAFLAKLEGPAGPW